MVTYSNSVTPNLTSITPSGGTAAGGTTVTLAGNGFGTDVSKVSVLFDTKVCTVKTVTNV